MRKGNIPTDDSFLWLRFREVREAIEPPQAPGDSGVNYLAAIATSLRIPLRSARECERFQIGETFLGILYDEIEEREGAAIDYQYALAVFHSTTHALACMVTTERSEALAQLKALPEALSVWDGRRIVGFESFSSVGSFKERALSISREVLGLS